MLRNRILRLTALAALIAFAWPVPGIIIHRSNDPVILGRVAPDWFAFGLAYLLFVMGLVAANIWLWRAIQRGESARWVERLRAFYRKPWLVGLALTTSAMIGSLIWDVFLGRTSVAQMVGLERAIRFGPMALGVMLLALYDWPPQQAPAGQIASRARRSEHRERYDKNYILRFAVLAALVVFAWPVPSLFQHTSDEPSVLGLYSPSWLAFNLTYLLFVIGVIVLCAILWLLGWQKRVEWLAGRLRGLYERPWLLDLVVTAHLLGGTIAWQFFLDRGATAQISGLEAAIRLGPAVLVVALVGLCKWPEPSEIAAALEQFTARFPLRLFQRGTPVKNIHISTSRSERIVDWAGLLATVSVGLAVVVWLLWRSKYGLDFTDESYYLIWISNPWIYDYSVSQFGFIYHSLYLLMGGDIVLLRQSNVVISFLLAWMLCWVVLRAGFKESIFDGRLNRLALIGISGALAATAMVQVGTWLSPTPSYNSLALQALLIAAIGMLSAGTRITRASITGWVLVGLAGWLALMAKPTTAAALAFVVCCYLLATGKLNPRLLAISAVTATVLTMCSAWIIDGSVQGFIERLINGVEDAGRLAGGHTLTQALRVDRFSLGRIELVSLVVLTALISAATCLNFSTKARKRLIAAALPIIVSSVALLLIVGVFSPATIRTHFGGLVMWAAPLGIFMVAALSYQTSLPKLANRNDLALILCFAVFPHVFAFGSNNNYWFLSSKAAVFWVLSGVTLLTSINPHKWSWRVLLPLVACAQAVTVTLLYVGMENPYRQTQPFRQNTDEVQLGFAGTEIILSRDFADYIRQLRQIATQGDFRPGDPMIDMTGRYPGALYALGARSTGRAWMIGGYSGSDNVATAALDRVPCEELVRAWVLTEPDGPRRLSPDVLHRYGIDLRMHFAEVGRLSSPAGNYPDSYEQRLLKPIRSAAEAQAICEQSRP